MPVFISEEELRQADVGAVVARAEEHITKLVLQIETHKAQADAARITAEQTTSLLEQKFFARESEVGQLEGEKAQLKLSLDSRSSQLAEAQARAHQLELELMKRDGSLESQSLEIKELQKSRKEMLDVIEKKNLELDEKNAAAKSYLERVLALTEERSNLESRIHEQTAEVTRLRALESRLSQEKDITVQHNSWLNQELQAKVSSFLDERQRNAQIEADLQARVLEAERGNKEKEDALTRSQDRVKELETELRSKIEELGFFKEDAATKEEHLTNEAATASKLAELYKLSSEEWSRKVNDLEGVINALQVHLKQSKLEAEENLRKEQETREAMEKEFLEAKENYEKKIAELQQTKGLESGFLQLENLPLTPRDPASENAIALPSFPYGVSGTALAASLLRDGWTLGTVYSKYQEAVDAWRHEMHERNRAQALLEKVLREIESKASKIMEERAEYSRMLDAYVIMEEKMKHSVADQTQLENTVRDLQAELRKKDRELKGALKDVSDLQTQVSVLVKECMDIQKRHGIGGDSTGGEVVNASPVPDSSSADAIISDKLLTFKDIHGMVEHNTQLRALVRVLAEENERKETEMKDEFESRLKLRIEEAAEKVNLVLQRAEEQNGIIERLQGTVGMYKRLYEDERLRSTSAASTGTLSDIPERESKRLWDISQDELRRQLSNASDQIRSLEEQLSQTRHDLAYARGACARAEAEAAFAKEKLISLTRESENQRKQLELIIKKNVESSQAITDYHRRIRESYQNVQNAEEQSRRLSIEVAVLEREKQLLTNAEQRAAAEASQLSDRVHRLQATLDTIETAAEVREVSRAEERRKLEEDVNRMQKEWVEAKHQLELERSFVRNITSERDKAMERIESLNQEMKGGLAALSASELRAKLAETRCVELEANWKRAEEKVLALARGKKVLGSDDADSEDPSTLQQSRKEIEVLREELKAAKEHVGQYKHIAFANEEALKKLQDAHSKLTEETAKSKGVMDSELKKLQTHLSDVESLSLEKEKEIELLQANREALLRETLKEVAALKETKASNQAALVQAESHIATLKEDLEKQHRQWRQAQSNYERQVMLQAETLQVLNSVNERVASLEQEEIKLRGIAEKAEAELETVKVSFYMEKSALEAAKNDLETRLKDLESQYYLLLDRLEAKHITLAEQDRKASASSSDDTQRESDVIQYLKRAKEAAETEISLLKQERTRLTKQFEAASRAAEEAQEKLRHHHESMRASIFTDEEFRALQTQVMELNLLREKNLESREENRKMSEENKELRERLTKLEEDLEKTKRSLREKQVDLEANACEIESLNEQIRQREHRFNTVLEKYKTLDVVDYEQTKKNYAEAKERSKELEKEVEAARRDAAETRQNLMKHEQEAMVRAENLAQAERRVQELLSSETALRVEVDKARRIHVQQKRKYDTLIREKEAMGKELEDLKAGKNFISEAAHQEALETCQREASERSEQIIRDHRESEQRVKLLEKILEKEREDLKKAKDELSKEKNGRDSDKKLYLAAMERATSETSTLKQEHKQYQELYGKLTSDSAKFETPDDENNKPSEPAAEPMVVAEIPSISIGAAEKAPSPAPEASPAVAPVAAPVAPKPKPPVASKPHQTRALGAPGAPSSSDPAAEKERQMEALRASISNIENKDKEKAGRKKGGRRIVRPTVEAPPEPAAGEMQVEGGAPEGEGDPAPKASEQADAENNTITTTTHKRSSAESLEGDQAGGSQETRLHPQKKARGNEETQPETSEHVHQQEAITIPADDEPKVAEIPVDEQDAREKSPEPPAPPQAEAMAEDVIVVEEPGVVQVQAEQEVEVVEPDVQVVDEMQTDQAEGAITDTEELPDVEDGEIGGGDEELEQEHPEGDASDEQKQAGEETNERQEPVVVPQVVIVEPVVVVASPAREEAPEPQAPAGDAEKAPGNAADEKAPGEKVPGEASSAPASAPAATQTPPPAPSSTTINLSDRARERSAQRRGIPLNAQSPPSPRATRNRGNQRQLRGNKGRGGGRT